MLCRYRMTFQSMTFGDELESLLREAQLLRLHASQIAARTALETRRLRELLAQREAILISSMELHGAESMADARCPGKAERRASDRTLVQSEPSSRLVEPRPG